MDFAGLVIGGLIVGGLLGLGVGQALREWRVVEDEREG